MKTARHNRYFRCASWLIAVSLFVTASVGCEDDKIPPTSVVTDSGIGKDAITPDHSDVKNDAGDTEVDVKPGPCDGVVCVDGEACVDGGCVAVGDIGFSCEAPRDLGILKPGAPLEVKGNSDGQPVVLKTGCAAKDNSSQSVFKFRVAEDSQIHAKFLTTTQPVVMELREGACVDGSTALFCDTQPRVFEAKAGKDYYLIVEARHDYSTGEFKIELDTTALRCSPVGSWSCEGTKRVECSIGAGEISFECGSGCNSGKCGGDTCENAIVVSGPLTVAGETGAFENNYNFESQPTCSTTGVASTNTPGPDLIFSLPGLKAGQKILVDATNEPGRPIIGITRSCGISNGCVAGDTIVGKLEWQVDTAGDYFVIIDRTNSGNVAFDYRIDILD